MKLNIAVIGASKHYARDIIEEIYYHDDIKPATFFAVDHEAQPGKEISYGEGDILALEDALDFDYSKADIIISLLSKELTDLYGKMFPKTAYILQLDDAAIKAGDKNPAIIYDFNHKQINAKHKHYLIPDPVAQQITMTLNNIHKKFNIVQAHVTSMQPTSALSNMHMDELFKQTKGIYQNTPISESKDLFEKQIAFNALPKVGEFDNAPLNITSNEQLLEKSLADLFNNEFTSHVNSVVLPTFVGASAYINVITEQKITPSTAITQLQKSDYLSIVNFSVSEGYVTPAETAGEPAIYISRVRKLNSNDHGLSLWAVSDINQTVSYNIANIVAHITTKVMK